MKIEKCFEILELSPGATKQDADQARRDLVSIWHPDRVSSKNPRLQAKAEERIKKINAAYDRLQPYLYADQNEAIKAGFDSGGSRKTPDSDLWTETEPVAGVRPRPAPSKESNLTAAVIGIVLLAAAGSWYLYWEKNRKIEQDREVAEQRLQLSETYRAEVMEKISKRTDKTAHMKSPPIEKKAVPVKKPRVITVYSQEDKLGGILSSSDKRRTGEEQAGLSKTLKKFDAEKYEGERLLAAEKYLEAKERFESALKALGESRFKNDPRVVRRRQVVGKTLTGDGIVYGTQGYIRYGGRWVDPDDYRQNYVRYRGNI